MSRLRNRAAPLLLFGLAFALRSIPAPRIFESGSAAVHLFGTDSFYHLRRVLYTLENFPASLGFDRYVAFPFGGEPIWPPVFDWLLAALALPVYDGASPEQARSVETLLVWVPPLLGSLTVVVVYATARRIFGASVAIVSGVVLAVLPAHTWYSQLGFVDHHAAVALLFALQLLAAARVFDALGRSAPAAASARAGSSLRPSIALGLAFAALLLAWPGGILHVATIEVFAIATTCALADREAARRHARAFAASNLVAAACVAPFALSASWTHWNDFSPAVLSRFQLWFFLAIALHAALLALLWGRSFGETRRQRVLESTGAGLAILLLSASFFPALVAGAFDAARWLFKDEVFQAVVAESRPLFQGEDGFDSTVAEVRLTRLVYLTPLAAAAMLRSQRGDIRARSVQLLVLTFVVLALVTLLQRRFFNSWSVVVAIVIGFACVEAWRWAARPSVSRWRLLRIAALSVALLWAFAPMRHAYQLPLRNVVQSIRGERLSLPPGTAKSRQLERAAAWLRDHSPPTSGFLDSNRSPEYGVIALWTHGHLLEYVGRRPSIANNFGDDVGETGFLASYRFFQGEEAEARDLARQLRVGYVLLRTTARAEGDRLSDHSMQRRLSAEPTALRTPDWLELVYDEPLEQVGTRDRIRIFRMRRGPTGG